MYRQVKTTPRRRPRQTRSKATVDTILEATARVLIAEGFDGLTTTAVAEAAGVSIGSLYQYFPDKEALVAEIRRRYEHGFRERLIALVRELNDLPLDEAIARCVRALIEIHLEDTGLHNAISADGIGDTDRRLMHQLAAGWLESRRDDVRRPDRALAAAVALDAAESLIHGMALRDPERLADAAFAGEVTDLLVRYLAR